MGTACQQSNPKDLKSVSRRTVILGGAGFAAALSSLAGLRPSLAQEAGPGLLLVQNCGGGSIEPDEAGGTVLTLLQAHTHTVFFTDRPGRSAGVISTAEFIAGFGETFGDDPPNAALVAETPAGDTAVVVVELLAGAYDADGSSITYQVRVLESPDALGFALPSANSGMATGSFGAAALFVDDIGGSNLFVTVTDSQGIALPSAQVTVSSAGSKQASFSDQLGEVRFLGLMPGSYTVAAELAGFATATAANVELQVGQNTTLEMVLTPEMEED